MGSTPRRQLEPWKIRNHPHIHGEYLKMGNFNYDEKESSPYTWGVRGNYYDSSTDIRIIPIYMGSTINNTVSGGTDENHPHIHGEYLHLFVSLVLDQESSPYTWGVLSHVATAKFNCGIIPIYMGSTIEHDVEDIKNKNHPHIHGEYGLSA